ncbi:MAG: glycerophosphodiester phosphodiesterase family protein [Rubricoccaceae bacterium]|nr:glycerophosphodiester phosphodiesterase family protein [Rubricoccaceae bacterium]
MSLLLLALALLGGCGSPREIAEPPPAPAYGAASSVHYRDWASADDLAAALRWQPGAPLLVSAHRGGPGPGRPENALATFEYALNFAPALIEADVRQAADGTLVLLHDATLDRTTTGRGPVAAQTLAGLRRLYLLDPSGTPTPHRIPTLAEALAWAEGRTVLLLDVKAGVPPPSVVAALRAAEAEDQAVVIAYTLDDLLAYHALAPDLVLSATATTLAEAEALLAAPVDPDRLIAFAGVGAADPALVARLHEAGIRVQAGAFGDLDAAAARVGPAAYAPLLDAGVDVVATDDVPAAARVTRRR